MPGPFYFAWVDQGVAFDPDVHNVFDERVLSITISHAEGDIPSLQVTLKNPKVGLLAAGRNVWCWLSWFDGTDIVPMFNGRLIGIPSDIQREAVQLEFTARPPDLPEQKEALADTLRQLPWWDELWVNESKSSPDTVLESRSVLFHIDRVTLEVTVSDVLQGEDGDLTVEDHLYNSLAVNFGETPLRRVDVVAEVSWVQVGTGDVDLTDNIWQKFKTVGSPFNWPMVGSYTSDGLAEDWPKPLDDIGGGWTMSDQSIGEIAAGFKPWDYQKVWTDQTQGQKDDLGAASIDAFGSSALMIQQSFMAGWVDWTAVFQVTPINQHFIAHYDANRDRSEKAIFSVEADVQPIVVDPEGTDIELMEVSSDFVDKPVDQGEALPIEDLRRNCYFPTSRGLRSLENLMLLARAKLRFRSRAVNITFRVKSWVTDISCRMNVVLVDDRLPGGQAAGKITSYKLFAKGSMYTEVTIGCAVGRGEALPAVPGGDDQYADNYSTGYTIREGTAAAVLPGELVYDTLDVSVIDDDGVDLFNMTPGTVLQSLTITNGSNDQQSVIDIASAQKGTAPDPIGALKDHPTQVEVILVPVQGGAFYTEYPVTVRPLVIPKLIDLEAPSV